MGLKIALVSPYDFPYPGGVTEHIMALTDGLRRRGHEVQILAACSGYRGRSVPNTRAITRHVTVIPVGGARARVGLSPLSYVKIRKILQTELFDIIHLQEPLTPSITWWVLMQACTLPNTVTVGTFHAYHEKPNLLYKYGRPVFAEFFTRLNSLIAVSKAAYHFAYQMFPGDYQIIPNGVDLDRFGKPIEILARPDRPEKMTILFVGRLDKRKGFSTLLEAFIKIKPGYPQLHLQVIGPFRPQDCYGYQKKAQAQGVTDIEFLGYITPERLPGFYHQADIFCAPSLGFESFGIVLLEAMAAGLPVIASDIAGYRTLVTHGQEGLLVSPGEVEPLITALRQLLDRPRQRCDMGRRGRLKANQYDWDLIVDRTLEVYVKTIQRKSETRTKYLYPAKDERSLWSHSTEAG